MSLLVNPSAENADGIITKKSFILLGDVDGDGFITNNDVNMIFNSMDSQVQTSSGMQTQKATVVLTPEQKERADLNNDGLITALDAQIIQKYIYERNNKSLPKSANYLVELISIRNKLRLYEPHNYAKDYNNRLNSGDTLQLINSGASDYDIIGSLLVNENVAHVNIDVSTVTKDEAIYQMLAGNVAKDLSFDLDKSGNITQNDYAISRGLEIDKSIAEAETPIITTAPSPETKTIQVVEEKKIENDMLTMKTLPAEIGLIENGGFISDTPNLPVGGGSLPGQGTPSIPISTTPVSSPQVDYVFPADVVGDNPFGSERGTAPILRTPEEQKAFDDRTRENEKKMSDYMNQSNISPVIIGIIIFAFLIFSD